jgi:hypothetical protein
MAAESMFVDVAHRLIERGFRGKPLEVRRGAALLYQVTVSNRLEVMSPERVRSPKRGDSAFETDLCVFERKDEDVWLPRVVMEFKTDVTTHTLMTYSTKAERHKQIYPYLRYGLIASSLKQIPGRFFKHNEGLDFFLCTKDLTKQQTEKAFASMLEAEIGCSRLLEEVAFGSNSARLYRSHIIVA